MSQVHRLRALNLLSQFLDLGPWTVNQALSVGIFPYISKLLQSPAPELKPVLIFIWSKIIAVDSSCQNDLLKDNGYNYFIHVLSNAKPLQSEIENRPACVFILTKFCDRFEAAQDACIKNGLIECLVGYFKSKDSFLKKWCCILLGKCIEQNANVIQMFIMKESGHDRILQLAHDDDPEVRAAAIYVLGVLLNCSLKPDDENEEDERMIANLVLALKDGSPLVRQELVSTLSIFISIHEQQFITIAYEIFEEEKRRKKYMEVRPKKSPTFYAANSRIPGRSSVYSLVWKAVLCLSCDIDGNVANNATHIVDCIMIKVLNSHLMQSAVASIMHVDDSSSHPTISSVITSTLLQFAFGESTPDFKSPVRQTPLHDISCAIINSTNYEHACTFFLQSQMEIEEAKNPGSLLFTAHQHRQELNTSGLLGYEIELLDVCNINI